MTTPPAPQKVTQSIQNEPTNPHKSTINANELNNVLNQFKNWYDISNNTEFKETVLYGILFSGVIDGNIENVQWAIDRGANAHQSMPVTTRSMLTQLGYRL
jgi:hypothetical protein